MVTTSFQIEYFYDQYQNTNLSVKLEPPMTWKNDVISG